MTTGLLGVPAADGPCPDCEAPADHWCFRWCPRFIDWETVEDDHLEYKQAGDHPDGF